MNHATHTIFSGAVRVTTYGRRQRLTKFVPTEIAKITSSRRVGLILAPSNRNDRGFKQIRTIGVSGKAVPCEGACINHKSALIIQTADCPVVIIRNMDTELVVETHAGRPALTPIRMPNGALSNVITTAYMKVLGNSTPQRLQAHITAHICGECFLHDHPGAEEFIRPFDQFGETVFTDRKRGALDVGAVIRQQLKTFGLLRENISEDVTCTKESDWLASHRNGHTTRNIIVVERLT